MQDPQREQGRPRVGARSRLCRPAEQMGQPVVIGRDGTCDAVIAKYRAWILRQPALQAALGELRGKDLVC